MAFDFSKPLDKQADEAREGGASREVRAGTYTWQVMDVLEARTKEGDEKVEANLSIVAQDDGETDLIGTTKKRHFVTGHKKPEVAKSAQGQYLAFLKACGVDLTKVKDLGGLYMARMGVIERKPRVRYTVSPQQKDPKYLDWVLVKDAAPTQAAAPADANDDPLFRK